MSLLEKLFNYYYHYYFIHSQIHSDKLFTINEWLPGKIVVSWDELQRLETATERIKTEVAEFKLLF